MKRQAEAMIPTTWGDFRMIAYATQEEDRMPHLAMVADTFEQRENVLIRIHSECLTGDLFGSERCDCGEQLDAAMERTFEEGGIVIYLRQEGRNIGLINKLKAYRLQDQGLNTIDANTHLGLEIDGRTYDEAIAILEDLGVRSVRLLTNNPEKIGAFEHSSIELVRRVPLQIAPKAKNEGYINTKKDKMGHLY